MKVTNYQDKDEVLREWMDKEWFTADLKTVTVQHSVFQCINAVLVSDRI